METSFLIIGAFWVAFSLIAGLIAHERELGFTTVFLAALVASPLAGLLLAFGSKRKKDIEHEMKVVALLEKINFQK